MSNFPTLFSPLKFGPITVKNRLFSAPMGTHGLNHLGFLDTGAIEFYENLAKGGIGAVCIGETLVDTETGNNHGLVFHLDDPAALPSLLTCTDAIHRYGALAGIEILHPGQRSDPSYNKDNVVYGPSGGKCHYGDGFNTIVEMDEAMIERVVNAFGNAAEIAMLGGCDYVTVHAGHGWLLNQFLSPANNHRTDRFGGSIENRCRIFLMVADNIRAKCGPNFPIDFRISGEDFMPDGATLEDTVYLAQQLAEKIDMLHVSATSFHNRRAGIRMFPSMFYPRGVNAYLAEEIKKHVQIPVITVGGFNDPAHMEKLLAEKRVDGIALARCLLADPLLAEKARTGQEDDIVYCVRCNQCMSVNFVPYVKYAMGVSHCAVNPWHHLISEHKHRHIPNGQQKVLVIGGGPAGMEAALGAAECGHQVILCEKGDALGGMLLNAFHPEFKRDIKDHFIDVLARRIEKAANIELRLNTAVTPELVQDIRPDALIVALGAKPYMPDIPGLDDARVIHAIDIHRANASLGQKVVIIGGGLIGCEEGINLAKYQGKEVTVIEMTNKLASGAPYMHYLAMVNEFEQLPNLHFAMEERVTAIGGQGVHTLDASGQTHCHEADSIVLAAGMTPLNNEAEAFRTLASQVYIVGDCHKVAQMNEAVLSGYFAGYNLQRL
ncbi:MAG: NAD(P)/FAD-dependent oxidoreductase [Clostridiales bacterium]|nr:NAD(P)/FAD-dependent oxidoreductase [Clostridiales bacterium]